MVRDGMYLKNSLKAKVTTIPLEIAPLHARRMSERMKILRNAHLTNSVATLPSLLSF
jgi:hypothetical protein